jgi:hypothetical protein
MANPNQQYYDDGNYQPQYAEGNYQEQGQYEGGQEGRYDDGQYAGDQGQEYDPQQHYDANVQYEQEVGYGDGGGGDNHTLTSYSTIPDIMFLNHYCANAHAPRDTSEESKHDADLSWEPVREWLRTHSADEVRAGAQQLGDSAMTALHFACRNAPPADVIDVLLSIAIDTAQWQDSFGWLPIHYACACGAATEVIKSLAEAFPDSKATVDKKGRTPLHFALGNSNPDTPVSPTVVVLLSSTGAASFADDNGMMVSTRERNTYCIGCH